MSAMAGLLKSCGCPVEPHGSMEWAREPRAERPSLQSMDRRVLTMVGAPLSATPKRGYVGIVETRRMAVKPRRGFAIRRSTSQVARSFPSRPYCWDATAMRVAKFAEK